MRRPAVLTDDNLTALLHEAFEAAAKDLHPPNGLTADIRRNHQAQRRRAMMARGALPLAVAAAFAAAVITPSVLTSSPGADRPNQATATSSSSTPTGESAQVVHLAGYRFTLPVGVRVAPSCPVSRAFPTRPIATRARAQQPTGFACLTMSVYHFRTGIPTRATRTRIGPYQGWTAESPGEARVGVLIPTGDTHRILLVVTAQPVGNTPTLAQLGRMIRVGLAHRFDN
jgi:hypothetical protein